MDPCGVKSGVTGILETIPDTVVIPPSFLERMIRCARTHFPNECCGVLGGRGRVVTSVHPLKNDLESTSHFFANPQELFDAVKKMRKSGEDMIGIYHSHPNSAPEPSERDRRENYYPGLFYFIISLQEKEPVARCYILNSENEFYPVKIV